jgi:cytochrome c-type biogenesis protein CcmH/NrfG
MQEAARLLKLKQDQEAAATAISVGQQRLKEGRLADALTQFETATRLAPQMAEGWFYLSQTLSRKGQLAESRKILTRAIQLDPNIERRLGGKP